MSFFTLDEVRLLAAVVDDYFCDRNSSYQKLLEKIILECVDPKDSLITFFTGYIVMAPSDEIEESIRLFFDIPFEQIPLYVFPKSRDERKASDSLCPTLEEGPYPWQVILARWRVRIKK